MSVLVQRIELTHVAIAAYGVVDLYEIISACIL